MNTVYMTSALADVLLDMARGAEPDDVSAAVSVTRARELDGADHLPPETQVFTEFVLPELGRSVNAVFGVDLSTPARQAQGRFISHPLGELGVTKRDDLAEVCFVAVPPWKPRRNSFGAFDRRGRRLTVELVDAEPPEEFLAGD